MKKNGFTLIELLAVIMVLAIIALISTPVILNVIDKAEKGSFEDSAYGVLDAAKLYYANMNLDEKGKEEMFTFPEDNKLKLSGKKPASGKVVLEEDGKIGLAISNGKWCAIKNQNEEKISITEYSIEECKIKGKETDESCFVVNDSEDTITNYTCTDTDVIIPSEINGKVITKIGNGAFYNKNLTSVVIPESIVSIDVFSFACNQLQRIKIPDSVMSVGSGAFNDNQLSEKDAFIYYRNNIGVENKNFLISYGGAKRDNIVIPDGITQIMAYSFSETHVENVVIPESVIYIGSGAFRRNQLQSVTIPKSVTNIAGSAFESNKITSVKIAGNVKIGDYAFRYNPLVNVEFLDSVDRIEESIFRNYSLTSVIIGESVTSIGAYAFYGNQLDDIIIPNSVTTIGNASFDSNQLQNVKLSNHLVNIGKSAFSNNQLMNVEIPSSVTSIGTGAFQSNQSGMKVIVNKASGSIIGSPWGAASVEWTG